MSGPVLWFCLYLAVFQGLLNLLLCAQETIFSLSGSTSVCARSCFRCCLRLISHFSPERADPWEWIPKQGKPETCSQGLANDVWSFLAFVLGGAVYTHTAALLHSLITPSRDWYLQVESLTVVLIRGWRVIMGLSGGWFIMQQLVMGWREWVESSFQLSFLYPGLLRRRRTRRTSSRRKGNKSRRLNDRVEGEAAGNEGERRMNHKRRGDRDRDLS